MFLKRYELLKSRNAKDWWTSTFGDPVSWMLLAIIGDWKFITPNLLTVLTFISKIIASIFIAFGDRSMTIYGAFLLQLGVLFDHMDGNLARYRNDTTLRGGFMDRILDGTSILFIFCGLSWHLHVNGEPSYYLLMGPAVASFYLIICYIYWSFAYYEKKILGHSKTVHPGAKRLKNKNISTLKYIISGQKKIFNFNHIDYYFWISFAIILDLTKWMLWFFFFVVGGKMIKRFITRTKSLSKLDQKETL